ncbi:MAG: hypothetical protein OEW89_00520 [Gammaproteobacteria bacterium]|nr:hypothetical protein [Gammaproteobacteria bacterium]
MLEQHNKSQGELNFIDIWKIIVFYKKFVLGISVMAMLLALILVSFKQAEWEATGYVRVGGIINEEDGQQYRYLIEPVPAAVARMKLRPFQDKVFTKRFDLKADEDLSNRRIYYDSLDIEGIYQTDFLKINVKGYSEKLAILNIKETVATLQKIHNDLASPLVKNTSEKLDQVRLQIEEIQKEREKLLGNNPQKNTILSDKNIIKNIFLSNILNTQESEIRKLELLELDYKNKLKLMNIYPTALVGEVYIDPPNIWRDVLIVVLAGIMGVILGVAISLFRKRSN